LGWVWVQRLSHCKQPAWGQHHRKRFSATLSATYLPPLLFLPPQPFFPSIHPPSLRNVSPPLPNSRQSISTQPCLFRRQPGCTPLMAQLFPFPQHVCTNVCYLLLRTTTDGGLIMQHLRKAAVAFTSQPLHYHSKYVPQLSCLLCGRRKYVRQSPAESIISTHRGMGIASLFQLAPGPLPQSSKSLIATYLAILVQHYCTILFIVV